MAQASESAAIYWDFENLHANLVDQAHGQGAYLANRFRPQDEVIDVCPRRSNFDPPCRLNFDPGLVAGIA